MSPVARFHVQELSKQVTRVSQDVNGLSEQLDAQRSDMNSRFDHLSTQVCACWQAPQLSCWLAGRAAACWPRMLQACVCAPMSAGLQASVPANSTSGSAASGSPSWLMCTAR